MKTVLTIAGSDSIGGAGIQADLKTIEAHKIYGMSAITCVTAQNTLGVLGITELDPEFVALQIRAVFEDIRPDAVKIGMVGSADIAAAIADTLEKYEAKNIVVDPVMVASTGAVLMADDAVDVIVNRLLPLATVVTPNTHGTGCTLSSAIACGLARDYDVQASIAQAKAYLTGALEKDPQLGKGVGPLNHIWNLHR